ncbi:radical SAM protein [Desulfosporosinus sp. Sb-LF]|uniref:radical SAM protein n=1 Tax=Desulfosporosinus sp. Sb-LF TaxID=2560027 RepID=UPI00107F79B3|nr:radical SAM protein [Desulfosporosinus sp. Sb-LF]TGE32917.1 radical SAM protein [Desulfosporosinus sp. Sb-LF]
MKDVVDIIYHPSPSIERLYLELTNRCNLSCEMCYRQNWQEPLGDMSSDVLSSIAGEVTAFPDLKEIILGGIGEPTIADNFRQAVELFAPKYEVTVTTNGTTLNDQMIEFLISRGVARIALSVDSTDVLAFDAIRHQNVQGILESTRHIADLQVMGKPEIIWEFVAMKSTLPFLRETVRQAAKLGVNRIFVTHVLPMRQEMITETLYYPTLFPETDRIFREAFLMGLAKGIDVVLPQSKLRTERYCKFVETQSAVVRWDGQVSPCYRFLHSYPEYVFGRYKQIEAHSFGSLRERSLLEIWTSTEFMSYRYNVTTGGYPSCTDCEFVNGCDMVFRTDMDCLGNAPSCGDCLWGRGITVCP